MGCYGVAYLSVGAAPWLARAVPLIVAAHTAAGANWAMSNYALQAEVPDGLRGRVFAVDMMLATLAVSVSQLAAGAVVDRVSPRVVVAVCGAVTLGYAVIWRFMTRRAGARSVEAIPL
jgi:hypothetical protein